MAKKVRREFQQLKTLAYERELKIHLEDLAKKFDQWKAGKMSSGELSYHIHKYDRGVSEELFSRYNTLDSDMLIAHGLVAGFLKREEISDQAFQFIESMVEFYESQKKK